ncbi:MAG: hypothetical protein WC634_02850 [archaeon]
MGQETEWHKSFEKIMKETEEKFEKSLIAQREGVEQGSPIDVYYFYKRLIKELEKHKFRTKNLDPIGKYQPKLVVYKDNLKKEKWEKLLIFCSNKGKNIGFSLNIDLEENLKKFSKNVYIIIKRWPPIEGKSYFLISYINAKDDFKIWGTRQSLYNYNQLKNAVEIDTRTEDEFLTALVHFLKTN